MRSVAASSDGDEKVLERTSLPDFGGVGEEESEI